MATSVKTSLAVLLFWCRLISSVSGNKEHYVIYFRQGNDKITLNVEMDLKEKVALLTSTNPQSRMSQTVSLYDYSMNVIAFKDEAKNACYLEKMKDTSLVYERRLLQSLRNQVVLGQADTLYVDEPPLTRRQILNNAGFKIAKFCTGFLIYPISGQTQRGRRRSKRAVPATHIQRTYSHHEHLSHNYASFGHETLTPHSHGTGGDGHEHQSNQKVPVWLVEDSSKKSQPSAFEMAVAKRLGQGTKHFRSPFDTPGKVNYANANAAQINTRINSGYPGHGGFAANGQFSLTGAQSGQSNGHNGQQYQQPHAKFPFGNQQNSHSGNNFDEQSKVLVPVYIHPNGQVSPVNQFPPNGQDISPGHLQPRPEMGFSSQSQVDLEKTKVNAGASAQGAHGLDSIKTQVQGSASLDGSFQAQSQSSSAHGTSQSQTHGSETGAQSSSSSQIQNVGQSQTQTQLAYDRSAGEASAQSSSNLGSISTQSRGGRQGGKASSQAQGQGMTSSLARVGLDESSEDGKVEDPFLGKAEAHSQGGLDSGHSRTQVSGDHKGIGYNAVAQGTYGQQEEHVGPTATALPNNSGQKLDEFQQPPIQSGSVVPNSGYNPNGNFHLPISQHGTGSQNANFPVYKQPPPPAIPPQFIPPVYPTGSSFHQPSMPPANLYLKINTPLYPAPHLKPHQEILPPTHYQPPSHVLPPQKQEIVPPSSQHYQPPSHLTPQQKNYPPTQHYQPPSHLKPQQKFFLPTQHYQPPPHIKSEIPQPKQHFQPPPNINSEVYPAPGYLPVTHIYPTQPPQQVHPSIPNYGQKPPYLPSIKTPQIQTGPYPQTLSPAIHPPNGNVAIGVPINKPGIGVYVYPTIPSNGQTKPTYNHKQQPSVIPHTNGFRTRVVTSQTSGPLLPQFDSKQLFTSRPNHQSVQTVKTKAWEGQTIFQSRTNDQTSRQHQTRRGNGQRCRPVCSNGYRILKTVKICKINIACQQN